MKIMKKKKKRILESDDEDGSNVRSFIDDEAQCEDKVSSDEESDGSIADFIDDSAQNDTKPYYNNELTEVGDNTDIFLIHSWVQDSIPKYKHCIFRIKNSNSSVIMKRSSHPSNNLNSNFSGKGL